MKFEHEGSSVEIQAANEGSKITYINIRAKVDNTTYERKIPFDIDGLVEMRLWINRQIKQLQYNIDNP